MMISKEEVKHIAELSRLKFNEEEIEDFTRKFSEVLEYVEKLKEVDTEKAEPMYEVNSLIQLMREDKVKESIPKEDALLNAPDKEFGYFKLPKVVE
ncbi:Asp-tRNA(Asn)/Glu-tRNA(Gln) amidotransferase subunit GatC [Acidilutibacter cellobiosedens]|uniref:Aspartyl/glutamyl-tRNA(Asn/Gln) amidotransferase subunit C n=2 Tax=Acidilutibacter cellobiosedens TaxID=2507161 RepID=A0A410QA18_9FIRM|nr:Asp-tRNA(Asn)/Glu-tRNA(Gln) amidotransferase subunit GatC [Tissierellaceae bacterium]QAT60826.1 Asp-tRNA(Asn)/Glu-tRNA(Gln) amidotransferase subunit GatC [Acidilutibacter cellobiosedens]